MKKQIFSLAFAALALAAPLHAESTKDIAVRYGDLAILTPAGLDKLDTRLEQAIRRVCGVDESERSLATYIQDKKCVAAKKSEVFASREAALTAAGSSRRALAGR